ncbi:MAG TPA: ATP-dependent Clp protease ATP-binding subunit [Candidatus Uhrbacteria bacterium]|nr:ATP-dependent Clp protease ATP-binding subunit [Candidatus Uhrbacteria bacterium]
MPSNILKNFSTNYQEILVKSINLAWQWKIKTITPEFILYALILQKGSIGAEILQKANLKADKLKKFFNCCQQEQKKDFLPAFDSQSLKIIEKSACLAYRHKHVYIATEHLLLALIESNSGNLEKILKESQINRNYIKNQIQIIFNSTSKFQSFASSSGNYNPGDESADFYPVATKNSLLGSFAINLTDKKIQKNIDPIIGRENEISRLIEILMRRTKNNPLIIGDPGVGKTALVEGLAKKIIEGDVPEILANKKILALDIASVIAGTMFRGEFENRMKQILEEIKKDPDIIVFIDEIHNIIGAGSTQGSMDVANILKPALARGEVRCIGATTYEEYKKHLESDSALERRFQLIKIQEPGARETAEILKGVKTNYENYHQVIITDEAIEAAIELSQKYLSDRFFPDKALDLIDEAASKIKISQKSNPAIRQLKEKQEKMEQAKKSKEKAIIEENFKQAILFKKQEKEIQEQIKKIKNNIKQANEPCLKVTKNEICQIVAKITNIPLNELLLTEKDKFLKLEKLLAEKIIGQDKALAYLAQAIRRAKAGLSEQNKPLGSFIFIGPSGTGKTYTAKILSQILFDRPDALVKIDMSEFSEKFNISKLIGAPAGYVGYKESGKLTDAVKRNPNSVVLFDEIEKAHPDVFNLLLQIMDEGYITDAIGKKINFKNTLIIMTSNLGSEKNNKLIGFGKDSQTEEDLVIEAEAKKFFRPEFINRLDKIIIFNKLKAKDLAQIAKIELTALEARLEKQGIKISYSDKIIDYLIKTDCCEEQGARFIKQNIEKLVANPLSEKIFQSDNRGKNFKLKIKNNKLEITNG